MMIHFATDCAEFSEADHITFNRNIVTCERCITALRTVSGPKNYGPEASPSKEAHPVTAPTHYTSGAVECIDAIEAASSGLVGFEGFCTGNVIKYVWRWKKKNGVEDLKKAKWYLDRLIGYLETMR